MFCAIAGAIANQRCFPLHSVFPSPQKDLVDYQKSVPTLIGSVVKDSIRYRQESYGFLQTSS